MTRAGFHSNFPHHPCPAELLRGPLWLSAFVLQQELDYLKEHRLNLFEEASPKEERGVETAVSS